MLHFTRAKIVQERSPLLVFFEVFSHVPGKENVPGVAAIHHPLCHVDPSAREISLIIYIRDRIDRAAMNTHAQFELRSVLQFLADFQGALDGCFRIIHEDEHYSVAGR